MKLLKNTRKRAGAKISIVLLFVLLFLFLVTSVASAATVTPGDVNNDGRIDVNDVLLVMRHILAQPTLLTTWQVSAADVDGNGVININDVILIMQRSLKLIAAFPVDQQPVPVSGVVTPPPPTTPTPPPPTTPTPPPTTLTPPPPPPPAATTLSVSAAALSERAIRLTFARPVSLTAAGANVNFRYASNVHWAMSRNSADMDGAATSFEAAAVGSGETSYDITFAAPMLPGQGTVFIHYTIDSNAMGRIVDRLGNVLPNNTSASFMVTRDVTRPTVTLATVVNATTIDVTFSEPVTGATSTLNYTLTNPRGFPVTITRAELRTGTLSTYRLTVGSMAAGGQFTLTAGGSIRDHSAGQNWLVPYSTTLTVGDTKRPYVVSVSMNTTRTRLFVQFSEPMGPSALSIANYSTGDAFAPGGGAQAALPANTELILTGSLVTIDLQTALHGTQRSLIIGAVSDLAGNTLPNIPTVRNFDVAIYNPNVTDVRFLTRRQLQFTVDRHLSGTIDPRRIIVERVYPSPADVPAAPTPAPSFVNNPDGTATVTVNFDPGTFRTDLRGVVALVLEAGALTDLNGLTSVVETTVEPQFGLFTSRWWDYIPPAIEHATTRDANNNGRIDGVIIRFSEAVSALWVNDGTFNVARYEIFGFPQVSGNTVTISLREGLGPDTCATPAVTLIGSVQDNQGNELSGPLQAITEVDGAAPVIVKATRTGPGALSLTFSEPVFTIAAGTGNLVPGDIFYSPPGTAIGEALLTLVHTAGALTATATTTTDPTIGTSKVGAVLGEIYDASGNAARPYVFDNVQTRVVVTAP